MKKFVLALLATGFVPVFAQTNITTVSQVYTENFDGLPTANLLGAFSATAGTQAAISGVTNWSGAKIAGTGTGAMNLVADNGVSNAGALYSYGASSGPTLSDRALGSVASGTNIPAFGTSFVNNTGTILTSFTLNVTAEFWRSSTSVTNSLAFAYGTSGGSITSGNYLSSAAMTAASGLNVNGPASVATNGALNGNLAANQALVNGTVSLAWNPGQTLFIRWQDTDNTGADVISIRHMVYLALTYDHRLVDGADAARFLTAIKARLEEGAFEADLGL